MTSNSSTDNPSKELCQLWQTQPQSPFQMSPEELRKRKKRLNRVLLIRDGTVWFVGLFEAAWFTWILFQLHETFIKTGACLIILGMGFMIGQTWIDQRKRRMARDVAEASGNMDSVHFLRAELERQREFHRGIQFWSRLFALVPGLLTFGIAAMVIYPWPDSLVGYAVTGVTVVVVPLAIWLNRRKAREYQRQIEALDAITKR